MSTRPTPTETNPSHQNKIMWVLEWKKVNGKKLIINIKQIILQLGTVITNLTKFLYLELIHKFRNYI